jgi:hypothetical protein
MNFYTYLGVTKEEFQQHVILRLINHAKHPTFPLSLYSYGREAVHEHVWDNITRKCRGIIVNNETDEIVARPFEKFFNLGTADMPETELQNFSGQPTVIEKMDGFICTMYQYNGEQYIASKNSFTSIHAKWATNWYRRQNCVWPEGYTPVFEGINRNLRIVVDYGTQESLVLLALINNETGEEMPWEEMIQHASNNGIGVPRVFDITAEQASQKSLGAEKNFEGYVLTWYRAGGPPFRVKVKYLDYLRLHRLVTGVTPKHVYEIIRDSPYMLQDYLNDELVTPWFKQFVLKWKNALELRYQENAVKASIAFHEARTKLEVPPFGSAFPTRKQWAEEFSKYPEIAGILFGMLDGKDVVPMLWKTVKPLIKGSHTLVDAYHT